VTRLLAVVFAGFCAFLDLYATQPLLPALTDYFHAGKVAVSATLTAANVGVALAAPLVGFIADRLGRRCVIAWSAFLLGLFTLLASTSATLGQLIAWRFLEGVCTPGIFAATVAYINDEWPASEAGAVVAAYVTGTVIGGFSSRMIAGLVAARFAWPAVFIVLGALNLACAVILASWLPPEKRLRGARAGGPWFGGALAHFRNPRLLAAYAAGFCVLFTLMATFTWVIFYLAAPPFELKQTQLASIFFVYLIGAAITPIGGRAINRFGHRAAVTAAALMGLSGMALTLPHSLWLVAPGLALCCSGVFVAQSTANSFIGTATEHDRALAVGIYATFYYLGGSAGASFPGLLWHIGGWPACVALIACVQLITAGIAWRFWR